MLQPKRVAVLCLSFLCRFKELGASFFSQKSQSIFFGWFCTSPLEMKLFCRYIGGLSAGHISYSLGRLKYIAIYRIHSAVSNIYRNISDAIDIKSNNNNFHRSNLSIIFHFYFLLANQLEPQNNISQVIINQPLSCEHPWRKKSFFEPKAVLCSVKSSSWKFFNFRVSGENRNIHFNKALRHSNE